VTAAVLWAGRGALDPARSPVYQEAVGRQRRYRERRVPMPLYEFYCPQCQKEVSLTLTMKEREGGSPKCPDCKKPLEPRLGTFYSKTSKKS
jgi:putative FmdB family regulatory protein